MEKFYKNTTKRSEMIPVYADEDQYEINKFKIKYLLARRNGKKRYTQEDLQERDEVYSRFTPLHWVDKLPDTLEDMIRFNEEYEMKLFEKEVDFLDEDDILNELDNLIN